MVPDAKAIAEPFPHDRSGLSVAYEGDHLRVVSVASGSPGAAGGWKDGDLITAIDGRPIGAGFMGTEQSRWGAGDAGRRVRLTGSDGKVRTLVLQDYY
jgi:C-terminal processing protease CtpA/Prc